jgi:hypothetical protein
VGDKEYEKKVDTVMQTGILDLVSLIPDGLSTNIDEDTKHNIHFSFAKENKHVPKESSNIKPPFCLKLGRHIGALPPQVLGTNNYD